MSKYVAAVTLVAIMGLFLSHALGMSDGYQLGYEAAQQTFYGP